VLFTTKRKFYFIYCGRKNMKVVSLTAYTIIIKRFETCFMTGCQNFFVCDVYLYSFVACDLQIYMCGSCSHYRRRCHIKAPCCSEVFDCRHCHNEAKVHFHEFLWTIAVMILTFLLLYTYGLNVLLI